MFGRLRGFFRRNIVADVPAGMDFCLDCGELECSANQFAECPRRKARAAAILASAARSDFQRERAAKPGEPAIPFSRREKGQG